MLKFSQDGSKLLMFVQYSQVIALFNANNGSARAAIYQPNTYSLLYQPYNPQYRQNQLTSFEVMSYSS